MICPRRRRRRALRSIAMALAGAVLASGAAAKERLVRQLGRDQGTPPQWVAKIIQDPEGYLWLGTPAGLHRYDGLELQRWAAQTITQPVTGIAAGPGDGPLYVAEREGAIYRVTGDGAEAVAGPFDGGWRDTHRIAVDARGRLWVVVLPGPTFRQGPAGQAFQEGILFRQGARDGGWDQPLAAAPGHERVRVVAADGDGVLVATFEGVWRVDAGDRLERVLRFPPGEPDPPIDLLRLPDGALVICTDGGRLLVHREARLTELARVPGRARSLARRGDTLWVASDRGLTAVGPDGATEVLAGPGAHPPLTLLVDREGSLWAGGSRGAFQFPEPDTVAWAKDDGLDRPNMRLARTREGVFVTYWGGGLGLVERTSAGLRGRMVEQRTGLALCVSGEGTLWTAGYPGVDRPVWLAESWIASRDAEGSVRFHQPYRGRGLNCSRAPDGSLWLSTADGLYLVSATDQLAFLGPVDAGQRALAGVRVFEDARGTLWLLGDGWDPPLCRALASEVRAGRRPSWTCAAVPGVKVVEAALDTPSGAIWLATRQQGLIRYDGAAFQPVPGAAELPSANVNMLKPSRQGGFWISGAQYLWRVQERTDLAAGWSVEERLGPANGIMADGAFDVLEDEDGTLWLTTAAGLVQVPAAARAPRASEPRLQLIRVAVNGRRADPARPVQVPFGTNEVALEVSALLFRDPASVQYRLRLGPDAPWSSPSRPSRIQLVDVPSGSYRVEVSATTDGRDWTPPAALLGFQVPRPWHRQAWVWALGITALLAAAAAAQRARLAVRLRLERQRTQIALDLHDEMGSGLGSIRVLAGLAARGTVDPERQQLAAQRIERTARDLGEALTGIVWSLRSGQRTLRDLCLHVAERGHGLFPAEATAFETDFPAEWPAEGLPLAWRRALQLILMEALHNAAKHARAGRVVLGAAGEADGFRLWVEDDGGGIVIQGVPAGRAGGHGLPGMAERAGGIGARLEIGRARGSISGTRVEVVLPPSRLLRLRPGTRLGALREAWRTSRS
jgi:signal transduction histidine kinase